MYILCSYYHMNLLSINKKVNSLSIYVQWHVNILGIDTTVSYDTNTYISCMLILICTTYKIYIVHSASKLHWKKKIIILNAIRTYIGTRYRIYIKIHTEYLLAHQPLLIIYICLTNVKHIKKKCIFNNS